MRLDLRARGVDLDPQLRNVISRKLHFTLARFEQTVREVFVTFADQNGPKGGDDKVCRVRIVTALRAQIVIEEVDSIPERAVSAALDRAARTVARLTAKSQRKRPSVPMLAVAPGSL